MNSNPLVSVIMNCHNSEVYLDQAIKSVYSQIYTNWEIIFWDNASNDKTSEIAKKYDKKLKYFKSENKTNLGEARVNAVNVSKGDYLAFLDGDDLWMPCKLEKQMKVFFKNNKAAIVYSQANVINEHNKVLGLISNKLELPSGDIFRELVKENFIPFVSSIVSREKYYECGGFSLNLVNATDYNLFLKISYHYKVVALNDATCMYRQHNQNFSNRTKVIGAKESLEAVKNFLPNKDAKIGMKYQIVKLICSYIKELQFLNAIYLLIKNPDTIVIFITRINKRIKFLIS